MTTTTSTNGLSSSASSALSNSPAAIAAANKANAQKILTSMGAGSGVDTASLAQNLVDAERVPQENAINAKIAKNESKISGYGALSFILSELKKKFDVLKVKSDFNTMTVANTQPNSFSVEPGAFASKGTFDVEVLGIAKPQRTLSSGFYSSSDTLNAGNSFNLSLSVGGAASTAIEITPANATPFGVVSAINSANLPVKAQLVNMGNSAAAVPSQVTIGGVAFGDTASVDDFTDFSMTIGGQTINLSALSPATSSLSALASELQTRLRAADAGKNNISIAVVNGALNITDTLGRAISNVELTANPDATGATVGTPSIQNGSTVVNGFKIVLTGDVGAANSFVMTSPIAGLTFEPPMQSATNASIKVNDLIYTRTSNVISDLIPGSTVTLRSPSSGVAQVALDRDVSSIKTKLNDLVVAWNDANTIVKEVSDPKSTLDTYGATLVSDSTTRLIQQQLRNMVLGNPSSPAPKAAGLWQLGISITQTGELSIDNTKLDAALNDSYDDVVKLFTNDKNLFLPTTSDAAGIAGDAVKKITSLLGANGPMLQQSQTAQTQNNKYKDDLTKLQTRMSALLKRYTTQFATMQSVVGQTNSTKTSLKSSFDGMMATYTNK